MSETSDHLLVERSLGGDRQAFAGLVDRYQKLVFAVALGATVDAAAAEDVAQEAFVDAWRNLKKLKTPERVGAWIAGIARHLGQAAWRRRSRPAPDLPEPDPVPTPLDTLLHEESSTLLKSCLERIRPAYREALILYYFEDQSVARMATALGVSEDVAKQRLMRGRVALRRQLTESLTAALQKTRPRATFTAGVLAAIAASYAKPASAASAGILAWIARQGTATRTAVITSAIGVAGGGAWLTARAWKPSRTANHVAATTAARTGVDRIGADRARTGVGTPTDSRTTGAPQDSAQLAAAAVSANPLEKVGSVSVIGFKHGRLTAFGHLLDGSSDPVPGVLAPRSVQAGFQRLVEGTASPELGRDALRFHTSAEAPANELSIPLPSWIDLGGYTGIAVCLRGVSATGLHISVVTTDTLGADTSGTCVPTADRHCYGFHETLVPVSATWQQTHVPFAVLAQPASAVPATLDLEHATEIHVGTTGGAHDVWIAAMGLY